MRFAHAGRLRLAHGPLVGVAASIGLSVGFGPSRPSPALLASAAYGSTSLAALGLPAGGAAVLRHARRAGAPPSPARVSPPAAASGPRPTDVTRRANRP